MAKADSRPKAIIKAAIRSKCHVIAQRYPSQQLEKLHGSNVKWLVLSDELFAEVCSEFTIEKLELSQGEKRAMFDADWVPQVTYELITKPARPRRRQANQRSITRFEHYSTPPPPSDNCIAQSPQRSRGSKDRTSNQVDNEQAEFQIQHITGSEEGARCSEPETDLKRGHIIAHHNSCIQEAVPRPAWFETVLN